MWATQPAQQQYDQSKQNIQNAFSPNLNQSMKSGAIHGAIVGCVGGAFAGSSLGILVGPEGVPIGASAGCVEGGIGAAIIGSVSESAFSVGHSIWDLGASYVNYQQAMNMCSKL